MLMGYQEHVGMSAMCCRRAEKDILVVSVFSYSLKVEMQLAAFHILCRCRPWRATAKSEATHWNDRDPVVVNIKEPAARFRPWWTLVERRPRIECFPCTIENENRRVTEPGSDAMAEKAKRARVSHVGEE